MTWKPYWCPFDLMFCFYNLKVFWSIRKLSCISYCILMRITKWGCLPKPHLNDMIFSPGKLNISSWYRNSHAVRYQWKAENFYHDVFQISLDCHLSITKSRNKLPFQQSSAASVMLFLPASSLSNYTQLPAYSIFCSPLLS